MLFPRTPHLTRSTHPARPRLLLWLAVASLLLLSSCSPSQPTVRRTATPSPSAGTQISPAWTAVLNQIGPSDEVSLATALQAYTLTLGPLPGVQSPASGGGFIPSATLAVRMILRHYRDLTPAQQQAVLQRLGYIAPASTHTSPPAVAVVAARASAQAPVGPCAQPLVAPIVPTPVPTDAPGTADYRTMLDEFIPKLNTFFSCTLTLPVVLVFDPALHGTDTGAFTRSIDSLGTFTGIPVYCRIAVNPDEPTTAIEDQRLVIAHELVHCYQAAILGRGSRCLAAPDWLMEGSATWAAAIVSGATSDNTWLHDFWTAWLRYPGFPLFQRTYDALGFFALLDHAGISPWSVIVAMLTSQKAGPNNVAAYQAGTKAAPQEVLDEWASSYERNPALGLDWDLTGVGILPVSAYGGPKLKVVTLANGGQVPGTTPAYTALDFHLTSQADVVKVNITGTSRLIDSAHVERITSANGTYCTKPGGCACPAGSPYQGPAPVQLTGLVHLAVTGGPSGATGTVTGVLLQQFCSRKQPPASLPPITQVFCQHLMTAAEADQIMHPSIPTKAVVAATNSVGGSCDYVYAPGAVNLIINLENWIGPVPVSQQDIAAALQQASGQPKLTIKSFTPVSGVGDQAAFLALTSIDHGNTVHIDAFYVLYGTVAFDCNTYFFNSAGPSDAIQQGELQQCAEQVVSRL